MQKVQMQCWKKRDKNTAKVKKKGQKCRLGKIKIALKDKAKKCKPALEQVLNPILHLSLPVPFRKDPAIVRF